MLEVLGSPTHRNMSSFVFLKTNTELTLFVLFLRLMNTNPRNAQTLNVHLFVDVDSIAVL